MALITTITEMEATVGKWKLRLRRQHPTGPVILWSVIRSPAGEVYIPPRGQMLTVNGWQPVLKVTDPVLHVTEHALESILRQEAA